MKLTRMNVVRAVLAVLILAAGLLAYIPVSAHSRTTASKLVFHDAMRKLWEDHITWTRLYIVSAAANLPDKDLTAKRLLKNQADIGNAIKPFYGDAAGDKLTALLRDHILIAAQLIDATKRGDNSAFDKAKGQWYTNANEIADFLHKANPKNWSRADLRAMMKSHLDLTLKEAAARLNKDYAGDITAYDQVHVEILHMADMLSEGIIKQFPKAFD